MDGVEGYTAGLDYQVTMQYPAALPPRQRLIEIFDLNSTTGELIWRWREGNNAFNVAYAGKAAGRKNTSGHLQTNVDGAVRLVHRIVFKMVFDAEPRRVRHENGDMTDNRTRNLSAAPPPKPSRFEQKSKNKSGITSVFWNRTRQVWFGMIQSNHTRHYVGAWKTLDQQLIGREMAQARASLPDGRKERYKKKEAERVHTTG